nr:hypothetical protein [Tanacetum cinerariifolium]
MFATEVVLKISATLSISHMVTKKEVAGIITSSSGVTRPWAEIETYMVPFKAEQHVISHWMKMFPDKIKHMGLFNLNTKKEREKRKPERVKKSDLCVSIEGLPAQAWHETAFSRIASIFGQVSPRKNVTLLETIWLPAFNMEKPDNSVTDEDHTTNRDDQDDEVDDLNDCFDDEPDGVLFFAEDQIGEKHYNHEAYHSGGSNREC